MCPDSGLYSAYIDGEVPSPWKEKIEAHLASCPRCQKIAERYERLHRTIAASIPAFQESRLSAGYERLRARHELALQTAAQAGRMPAIPSWMRNSVRIPVPALAAMFLAVIFVPAWFAIRSLTGAQGTGQPYAATLSELTAARTGMQPTVINTSAAVYSPDLPTGVIQATPVEDGNRRVARIINYARTFPPSDDQETGEDVTMIRIPDVRHLHTTDESLLPPDETLPMAAGFDQ